MEKFKDIKGYEGKYQVSNLGNVKSLIGKGRVLKPLKHNGYLVAQLSKNGSHKRHKTHRLVALTFIPNPLNKSEVNHINGNKTDNRLENLEWVTHRENTIHAFDMGLNKAQKVIDTKTGKIYNSISSASKEFNVNYATLIGIISKNEPTRNEKIKSLKAHTD